MMNRIQWRLPFALCSLALAVLLVGCGTQGYAPTLSTVAHITHIGGSQAPVGQVTLTPIYGTRIVTYYPSGTELPYHGAATPVQLRQGSCTGAVIAPLTSDALPPAGVPLASVGNAPVVSKPDAAGGTDVSVTQSEALYVVVLAHPHDLTATLLACGRPLSSRRQFFDLYLPSVGTNGTGQGIVLMEPLVATRVQAQLATHAAAVTTWSIRSGSCTGAVIDQGTIAVGQTTGSDVAFTQFDGAHWWLSLTSASTHACTQVSA